MKRRMTRWMLIYRMSDLESESIDCNTNFVIEGKLIMASIVNTTHTSTRYVTSK